MAMKRHAYISRGTELNDVVMDPLLAAKMRDHQREGVKVAI